MVGLVALVYVGLARYSVAAALSVEGIAFFWPANAVVLAILLRLPLSYWGRYLAAMVLAELVADVGVFSPLQALVFGVANALEVTIAAGILSRMGGRKFSLRSLDHLIDFCIYGLGFSCAAAGLVGAISFHWFLEGSESYFSYVQTWWLGDSLGMLILTPLVLEWLDSRPFDLKRVIRIESALHLGGISLLAVSVFFLGSPDRTASVVLPLLLFPYVIFLGARLGTYCMAMAIAMVTLVAVEATRYGWGPYSSRDLQQAVLLMQGFLFSLSVCGLTISSVVGQLRERQAELLLRNHVMESMADGMVIADARQSDCPITYVNPGFERLTGYRASEVIGRNCRFLQAGARDQPARAAMAAAIATGKTFSGVIHNFRKDGGEFLNEISLSPVRDDRDQLVAYIGIQRDVTALQAAAEELAAAHARLKKVNDELEIRVEERTEALQAANARLAELAHTDALTGLWNRRYFDELVHHSMAACQRHPRPLSLLMADIDHFKRVNDQYGHGAGDQVLRAVSDKISSQLRVSDVLARYGGEEFVAFLDFTSEEEALQVAERCRKAVQDCVVTVDELAIRVTISVGVAQWDGRIERGTWMELVDGHLYAAKLAGRNRSQGTSPPLT
jgi:diguanylate cyclase (GGDEF)-like protein/PAS domain S-box-containing protein